MANLSYMVSMSLKNLKNPVISFEVFFKYAIIKNSSFIPNSEVENT